MEKKIDMVERPQAIKIYFMYECVCVRVCANQQNLKFILLGIEEPKNWNRKYGRKRIAQTIFKTRKTSN